MRDAFIGEVTELAGHDDRIAVLCADIGNHMFDEFRSRHSGRFHNVGIAEAAMAGMAAGMAKAGMRPFTYTIASFNPGRCAEQIRLDICQHNLPVVTVGVGAGLSYASLGPTHHALEDIAWMRAIPNMTVLCPGDPFEVRAAVRAAMAHCGPVYMRLGKKGEPKVHQAVPELCIGKALTLREGGDVALLAVGTVLPEVVAAAGILAGNGVMAAVYSLCSIKPIDTALLERLFDPITGCGMVAVVEEHVAAGGAWSAVAEWLLERGGTKTPVLRFGVPDAFIHEAGNQEWIRKRLGLDARTIAERIVKKLQR